jgi:hypothetical protein
MLQQMALSVNFTLPFAIFPAKESEVATPAHQKDYQTDPPAFCDPRDKGSNREEEEQGASSVIRWCMAEVYQRPNHLARLLYERIACFLRLSTRGRFRVPEGLL